MQRNALMASVKAPSLEGIQGVDFAVHIHWISL